VGDKDLTRRPARRTAEPARSRPAQAQREAGSQRKVLVAATSPRASIADWAQRKRNPLIFLAVSLVVVGTVGFRLWRSKFQDLPRIAEAGRFQGLEALDSGDFDTAHQLLSRAKRAVESLNDAVEGAAEIRQGADEAAIFTNLISQPLESILGDASPDPEEWSSRFASLYRGRSIIIGARIESRPDASGSGSYELDYLILPNGEGARPGQRVGRLDLTGFRLFEQSKLKVGDHVQFGARLASFAHDPEHREWRVGLVPDSGVFMCHPKALEAALWPTADQEVGGDEP
jgi:hypothetical protein